MTLRPYQRSAIDSLYTYWREGNADPALIVAPTGSGKSVVMAEFIREIQEDWPGTSILILTHVRELVLQDYLELIEQWPDAPAGIFSAGLKRKELHALVLFASVQSIDRHAHKLDPAPEIVIIDEAHLVPRKADTRYQKTLSLLRTMYPNLRVVGLTATPYRLDSGWLHTGKDALFSQIVYDIPVQMLIDEGYLSPITTKAGAVTIDTTGVKHTGREFNAGELQRRAMEGDTTRQAVADMVARAEGRKKWIVFAAGVAHAYQISDALTDYDVPNAVITGNMKSVDRDKLIHGYRIGSIRALVNVNVLTTGFNVPSTDLIALLRPTESPGLYVQAIGRGMRIAPGKADCLVLDYAGNALRHGPIDAVTVKEKGDGEGVPPAKECPECHAIIAAGLRYCPYCGHEFPPPEIKIQTVHKEAPLLKSQIEPEWVAVDSVDMFVHKKPGKPDSVRLEYRCGMMTYKEWIFPEALSERASYFFVKWCREAGVADPPRTAREFIEIDVPEPERISVIPDGKYIRVARRDYGKV